ncbi:hypothetical protein M409DRAFT_15706 [Zasmidium cellare ATCC 36951]|uniref:Uncharacterized protein n=1 Tax=Zasmidium cellare ATCC 36951 TaxID=1080233 RepID=A0A6A6D226_ZASCE|nr:uncharacterized protein M409DRAFT_15706 [Zasmidium cellare ATCC 36951]KAF2173421.1 hypothetical protein M409DRAFT_15706 [Zasmidium cellare ATCC 36951]
MNTSIGNGCRYHGVQEDTAISDASQLLTEENFAKQQLALQKDMPKAGRGLSTSGRKTDGTKKMLERCGKVSDHPPNVLQWRAVGMPISPFICICDSTGS